MSCLNSLMNDMFDKIATEASKLSRISKVDGNQISSLLTCIKSGWIVTYKDFLTDFPFMRPPMPLAETHDYLP